MHKAKVKPDPKTFRVSEGQLDLFFNDFYEGRPFERTLGATPGRLRRAAASGS